MNCGYDCPCCSGSGDCETCDAMMMYEDNWKNTIVEGAYLGGTYDGFTIPDYDGDPCHLNIVKYLDYMENLRRLHRKHYDEMFE